MTSPPTTTTTQPSHDINGLYTVLFETIAAVRAGTMPLETAEAVNDLSQTAINAAKVEVDFIKATDATAAKSQFLKALDTPATTTPQPGTTVHRLR